MKQTASFLEDVALDELRTKIVNHDIYSVLGETRNLQCFMEHHVFAVCGFSLWSNVCNSNLQEWVFPGCHRETFKLPA